MERIQFSKWPEYDLEQISKVSKVLESGKVNYWTGNETKLFEKEFSKYIGVEKSIAIANGSLALRAAYKSLNLSKGDEVITTPRTFIATASEAAALGLRLVFADVDPDSGSITAETIEPLITKKTKVIAVVHLGGWPADMQSIIKLARIHNISVLEDCSQAHGAKIKGQSVGTFGDISTWSFCQDKIISTGGEGGMISTSNLNLFKYIESLKDHGKNFDKLSRTQENSIFNWLHDSYGTNFRLTEIQSAIGRIQLNKLEEWNAKRNANAYTFIDNLISFSNLRIPIPEKSLTHAWYRFYVFVKPDSLKTEWDRNRILLEIRKLGIPVFSGSCSEIYLEKCFEKNRYLGKDIKRLSIAKELGETSLCFLVHPTLNKDEIVFQIGKISSVLKNSKR